jgi:hypothetical protein
MHTVTLIVHPNKLGTNEPTGFRFAVHVTEGDAIVDPSDLATCVNAGWRPTEEAANLDGQDQAATAVGALRLAGLEVNATTISGTADFHPPTPTE